jgi:hypothetical protein
LYLLSLLLVLGYVLRFRRGPTAAEFYLPCYLALLWVTPWLVETRFFTVLVPWLVLYLWEALERLAHLRVRSDRQARRMALAGLLALVLINLVSIGRYHFIDRWSQNQNDEAEAYRWAAGMLQPSDVVLTRDPFAFYLLTGLHAMSYTASEQKYQPPYHLPNYLAKGGRVQAILFPQADSAAVEKLLAERGWQTRLIKNEKLWNFGLVNSTNPL